MTGGDVLAVQDALARRGFDPGAADGIYGPGTETAVRQFQQSATLAADGIVGAITWNALFSDQAVEHTPSPLTTIPEALLTDHNFNGGVIWKLTAKGIEINDARPETTGGEPITVGRVYGNYRASITNWANHFNVPAELIIATICTESSGSATAVRTEPGYISDDETPSKISAGLTQVLISTARGTLNDEAIDRAWLLNPDNAIKAGTAYIHLQRNVTDLDPPKVACAYNAGGVYPNNGAENRWKMRQYPIGTGEHADRFVRWFNDCFRLFKQNRSSPVQSYFRRLVS